MLPILSNQSIRSVDRTTMVREPIGSLQLMERAAGACADRIMALREQGLWGGDPHFLVLVGWGNNGGDGSVIARRLHEAGTEVRVVRLVTEAKPSPDLVANLDRLRGTTVRIDEIDAFDHTIQVADHEVIVDCIFGNGLRSSPVGWIKEVIQRLVGSQRPIIAIDVPSGLVPPEDGGTFDPEACIRAHRTLTFEVPRMSFLLPETGAFVGDWEVVPIQLDRQALDAAPRLGDWVEGSDVRNKLHIRPRFAHKGTFGHACIVAGSKGMPGASILATKGCLRSGVGLVTAHIPSTLSTALAIATPDAMFSLDTGSDHLIGGPDPERFTAIGVGPGLGTSGDTLAMLTELLDRFPGPVVLDADALNLIAGHPEVLANGQGRFILTPHPKEMDRLLGMTPGSSYERLRRALDLAVEHQCTVVLKGAYTATCTRHGRIFMNSTGNVGMAKGGSGDVLTGLLAGLLAQGYSPEDACMVAVYLHGSAGDLTAQQLGKDAMRPSDLLEALPTAWERLRGTSEESFQ